MWPCGRNPWLLYWGAIADFHPAPALLQPHTGHVEQEELACSFGHHGGPKIIRKEDLSSKVAIKLCRPLQGPTLPQGYITHRSQVSHTPHCLSKQICASAQRADTHHPQQSLAPVTQLGQTMHAEQSQHKHSISAITQRTAPAWPLCPHPYPAKPTYPHAATADLIEFPNIVPAALVNCKPACCWLHQLPV
jgi:hypothetical protein